MRLLDFSKRQPLPCIFLEPERSMSIEPRLVVAMLFVATLSSALPAQNATPPQRSANPVRTFDNTGAPDTSMFAPLNLPPGNVYRSGSGVPGPRYWEQRADYDLH